MRLGAVFPQAEFTRVDPDEIVAFVRALEDAGYDHLLVFDHVLGADSRTRPGWDGAYDHADPFLEPLVLFAFLLRECNLELVTDVLVLPQRPTALVAKQAATLELLAPGRLRLGVGIGWNEVEYDALGQEFATRAARMEEQVALLRRLWTEETVDHRGATDRVDAAGVVPLPARPVPVWLGCGADPRATARVGRIADGWLPMPQVQPGRGFEAAWAEVRAAAGDAGRDPDALGLEGHVWARADNLDRLPDAVARWRDAGAGYVAVNPLRGGAEWPTGHLDVLRRAAEQLV
ncbi:MAG: TIGR03619 family F420-dependent LLM class oxidoreductase [Acidimicrobiia bacterium]